LEQLDIIVDFLKAVEEDPRISAVHISIYTALFRIWYERQCPPIITLFSREVMGKAKVSGKATYFRCLQELSDYGYLQYVPSHNYLQGSSIALHGINCTHEEN